MHDYFLGDDPTFGLALVPFCFLSMLLYTRHPGTNFIFDEQEALLANPYVRSIADPQPKFRWVDAFYRDFWGLGPERSIGSYRPIPDLVWRALWGLGAREQTPFLHHWVNVLLHGVNGALVCLLAFHLTKRRGTAWLIGLSFTAAAVLTEAVSGVVGISDVLGATGAICALLALSLRLPWMVVGVFFATLFGLYSKESALCCVPLVPLTALFTAQITHKAEPRRWTRAVFSFLAAAAAFVLYVEARRRMFPAALPAELSVEANADKPLAARTFASILRWYAQPTLPKDPLNNPLVNAHGALRVAGALRVYFRGLVQLVFPYPLSGDYSAPQEPIPPSPYIVEGILGGLALALPIPVALGLALRAHLRATKGIAIAWRAHALRLAGALSILVAPVAFIVFLPSKRAWMHLVLGLVLGAMLTLFADRVSRRARASEESDKEKAPEPDVSPYRDMPPEPPKAPEPIERGPLVAVGLVWIVLAYFPVSNIPVLLPTVRAERFWYFPVIGSCLILGLATSWVLERSQRAASDRVRKVLVGVVILFFGIQFVAARRHAWEYKDDLSFWDATRRAVPRSAKAHLNYSVMKGARGDLNARLDANRVALELAPQWPMASIYLGDTLCRLHRAEEAWPHYVRGFDLAPNDVNLVALAMQCLWDEKALTPDHHIRAELDVVKDKHPGSWVEYLGRDILEHGEEHNGVDPKYRPRGYNEGPKE
ncbi:MAG: tetratricopeptide repeat protein [Deltaproteobacteria bacterium]|nr:tetratricopeptide repeat protein [Deltaproteobacteria bacterium]